MIDSSKLKKKAVHGVIWTSIQRFLTIFIQFVSGIILARLLSPDDFGCIGMLSIFMIVASSFIDGGFGSALIQKKRPSQTDYSTIFFWNFIVSIFIYLVLYISAPYIARYYHTELLSSVLRVQALVLIFNALTTIHINKLNKEFNFRKISVVSLISIVISLTVTIVMAYHGYGVWSLVTQNLLMAIIPTVIYWVTCPWRPTWVFSTQSFKELFGFGLCITDPYHQQYWNQCSGIVDWTCIQPFRHGVLFQSKQYRKVGIHQYFTSNWTSILSIVCRNAE